VGVGRICHISQKPPRHFGINGTPFISLKKFDGSNEPASIATTILPTHGMVFNPLHDAAEVARAGIPTVMLFVQSLRGLSHTRLEDTKKEHLEISVETLDRLTSKTMGELS